MRTADWQTTDNAPLRAPYPWFGGKSRCASLVWSRFGDTANYVEPFLGSAAMLLARPHWPWDDNRIETVNDADCYVANFWRALQAVPDEVARFADWPVNEADLHARHWWLVNQAEFRDRMRADPDYHDAKIAGWWVWGCCQWIGSGWCEHPEWEQLPHLGNAGRGVHRPSQQLPHLGNAGMGLNRAAGGDVQEYLAALADRFRRVRVCCGDWSRVCGPTPTVKQGLTAVFLDPPYSAEAGRDNKLYSVEDTAIAHDVRAWCLTMGGDERICICLAGYEGEHEGLESAGWSVVAWKAKGGYSSQGSRAEINSYRERLWFSPHCLKLNMQIQRTLIDEAAT